MTAIRSCSPLCCFETEQFKKTKTPKDLAEIIDKASRIFLSDSNPFCGPVRRLELEGRVFYGIHQDEKECIKDWSDLTQSILKDMGLPLYTTPIQVVGDAACYDEVGTAHNRSALRRAIPKNPLILWGFTGRIQQGGRTADVNGLVNEMITDSPKYFAKRCLASVVSDHTKTALSTGYDGSHLTKHFWLVHASHPQSTVAFDNISKALISLDGGVQSLNQALRCLELNQPLSITTNSREQNHHSFSIGDLVAHIRDQFQKECGEKELMRGWDTYTKGFDTDQEIFLNAKDRFAKVGRKFLTNAMLIPCTRITNGAWH